MSSYHQPSSKQPSPSTEPHRRLHQLRLPWGSRQAGNVDTSTSVRQSNKGARDLGVLNVDTNECKLANHFA